ncbi:hypothetical protein KY339_02470 [Candidatus Woesearchaeota archaeon]|nr:hypothetical protein [Candidatus Woesearchaeota archaeon]
MPKESKPKKPVNEVCENCLKWDQFEDECWVYWEGKKMCPSKVTSTEEWQNEKNLMQ